MVWGSPAISVCMVSGAYFPEISGGDLQCRTLANALKEKIEFFIITTCKEWSLRKREIVEGIPVYRINVTTNNTLCILKGFLSFLWAFLALKKKIHIIHLHGFSNKSIVFILLAKAFKKKIVQKLTSMGYDDPASILRRFGRIRYLIYSMADVFVCVSPAINSKFKESDISYKHFTEIPNGVDITRFKPSQDGNEKIFIRGRLLHQTLNKRIILTVGFFSYDKAPNCVYDAFKTIIEKFDDVFLVFIGSTDVSYFEISSSLVESLKRDIEKHGLGDRVIFIEKTHEIEDYYKISDIFVMASVREGMPNSLLEAMASGLPCIATRIPGVTDVIIEDGENGLLVGPRDVVGISRNLVMLLEDASIAKRLGQEARRTIVGRYSIADVAERYLKLYEGLVRCVG